MVLTDACRGTVEMLLCFAARRTTIEGRVRRGAWELTSSMLVVSRIEATAPRFRRRIASPVVVGKARPGKRSCLISFEVSRHVPCSPML
ncbi:MAG: hypothetical protein CYG60_08565 [Actinobacteria bacterium]|nr:MAG: hypothetical protein CYG60_08565 [Actinomycetota bacterium]